MTTLRSRSALKTAWNSFERRTIVLPLPPLSRSAISLPVTANSSRNVFAKYSSNIFLASGNFSFSPRRMKHFCLVSASTLASANISFLIFERLNSRICAMIMSGLAASIRRSAFFSINASISFLRFSNSVALVAPSVTSPEVRLTSIKHGLPSVNFLMVSPFRPMIRGTMYGSADILMTKSLNFSNPVLVSSVAFSKTDRLALTIRMASSLSGCFGSKVSMQFGCCGADMPSVPSLRVPLTSFWSSLMNFPEWCKKIFLKMSSTWI
mmetsp:Transcript_42768/g.103460  ORF Transcript_42768/g.103460 Transcript_42768/m.103460 type:complete len:266 (+) Transcript_42768:600-1397(+)